MIEEVLADIKQAEEKAAQIIADAQAKAREISLSATKEAEEIREEFRLSTKQTVSDITAKAQKEADKAAAEAEKAAAEKAQAFMRSVEKNIRGAGEFIADKIIKGNV